MRVAGEFKYKGVELLQFLDLNLKMQHEKIANIIKGVPCSLATNEIMELGAKCSSEGYSLEKLIQIAKTLFKSDSESCFRFLEYVEKHEITRNIYKDFVHQPWKMQIYYSLAALALTKGLKEIDKPAIEKWQKEFNKYLNLGSNVKTSAQKMYQLLHGFNSYYAGDFSKAILNFNRLDQADKKENFSIIALLGLAQSYYMIKKYDKALEYYKKALISNRNLPTKARLGMAYCFYELEKYQLAEKCFERILALDPSSGDAYIGLAVINYRNNKIDKYFSLLKQAFKLKPNDPLIILHLSEHFLITGEYEKSQKMCAKGLQAIQSMPKFFKKEANHRDDYEIIKAKFNNLIGQAHHAKMQFEQAKKYYELAKQKGLKYNDLALAQTQVQAGNLKQALKIMETVYSSTKPVELKLFSQFSKTFAYLQIKLTPTGRFENEEISPTFYYKQALKYNKNDYDALVEYSVFLHDTNDKKQTLKILQTALKAVQAVGKEPKAELLNNIGVSLIEDKNVNEAEGVLDKALKGLESYPKVLQEDLLRYHALYLTINFNRAVVLEIQHRYEEAIAIHRDLIKFNKFYIDSYVKLGEILHGLGRRQAAFEALDNGISQCLKTKRQELRVDKLYSMKTYLHYSDGNTGEGRDSFKKLGRPSTPYDILFDLYIGYESAIKKQVQPVVLKDFLRPSRNQIIKINGEEPHNVFSFMILVIFFLIDNKITKEQGTQYFNQLKIAEQEFPEIQYNFGVFSLVNEEYENALFCFNRFREKTKSSKADQYIALTYLLKGDYTECINVIKKSILNEPHNLKLRFQYAYAHEKRVQNLFDEEQNFKLLKFTSKYLTTCKKIHETISKIISSDYVKTMESPELKDRLKNEITKLRTASEDRERFVQSQMTYYGQKEKQLQDKERRMREQQAQKLQELKKVKENQRLFAQLGEDEDESQSQKIRKERRKRLMQLSIRQTQQANEQWKIAQERQKEKAQMVEENKKKRKNNEGKRTKKQKKNVQQEKQEDDDYESEDEFKDEQLSEDQPIEYEDEELQRRKRKKKKNKDRERERERSGSEDDKKKKKKKKKERKEREQREQREGQKKQEGENDEVHSEKGSNPFDQNESDMKEQEDNQEPQDEPHKKEAKKKNKKDDDEIDLNEFLIQ